LFGHLELHWATCLSLEDHHSAFDAAGRHEISDFEADEVTPSQLAVERQVEEREVARLAGDLEPYSDAPDVNGLKRQLGARRLPNARTAEGREVEHEEPPAIAG